MSLMVVEVSGVTVSGSGAAQPNFISLFGEERLVGLADGSFFSLRRCPSRFTKY